MVQPISVHAQDTSSAQLGSVLINLASNYPQIYTFLSGFSVVVGLIFIYLAMYKLKHMADFRSMMSGQQEIGKAFGYMLVGVGFIWLPFLIDAVTYSFFGMNVEGLQTAYPIQSESSMSVDTIRAIYQLMQLIGIISFIRGWFLLSVVSKGQAQQGTFGKAMTHLIAGVILINLTAFMNILEKTLGIDVNL